MIDPAKGGEKLDRETGRDTLSLGAEVNNNYDEDDSAYHSHNDHHLEVLPPVLALEFGRAGFKLRGSGLQSVRAVIQLGQLLISFQNLVYIHTHNIHHLIDLCLGLLKPSVTGEVGGLVCSISGGSRGASSWGRHLAGCCSGCCCSSFFSSF